MFQILEYIFYLQNAQFFLFMFFPDIHSILAPGEDIELNKTEPENSVIFWRNKAIETQILLEVSLPNFN